MTAGFGEEGGADFLEEVFGHIFGGRVVGHDEEAGGFDTLKGIDGILIVAVDEEAMVPVFVEPAFAEGFEFGEIDDPSDGVLGIAGHEEIGDVVMTMEVFAFPAVLEEAMTGAEFDAAHDDEVHGRWGSGGG